MAGYRQIHTKIWKDGWFLDLPAEFKLLFVYLFSNERANLLGLYDLPLKVIAFETDLPAGTVEAGLARLEGDGKVFYSDGWVWVRSLLHYNATNLTGVKIKRHLEATFKEIPDMPLKSRLMAYYQEKIGYLENEKTEDTLSAVEDTPPIPKRTEQEQEHELEQEQELEHEQQQETIAAAAVHSWDIGPEQVTKLAEQYSYTPEEIGGLIAKIKKRKNVSNPFGLLLRCLKDGDRAPSVKTTRDKYAGGVGEGIVRT